MVASSHRASPRQKRFSRLLSVSLIAVVAVIISRLGQQQPGSAVGTNSPPSTPAATVSVADPVRSPLVTIGSLRCLSLRGTPYEVGEKHGQLLRTEIRKVVDSYLFGSLLPASGVSAEDARQRARALGDHLPQTLVDELRGLAAGSGVATDDLLVLQACYDLANWGTGEAWLATQPTARSQDLLFGIGLSPQSGSLLAGQPLIASVNLEGEPSWCGLILPGQIGTLAAMSEHGLGVLLVPGDSADAAPGAGLPSALLVRRLLVDCQTVDEAHKLVEATSRPGPATLLVGQTADSLTGAAVEVTSEAVASRPLEQGRAVVTGHLRTLGERKLGEAERGGCDRYDRLRAWLFDNAGQIDEHTTPIRSSGAYAEGNRVVVQFQPLTATLRVWTGAAPAAEGDPVALRWDFTNDQISAGQTAGATNDGAAP